MIVFRFFHMYICTHIMKDTLISLGDTLSRLKKLQRFRKDGDDPCTVSSIEAGPLRCMSECLIVVLCLSVKIDNV